MKTHQNRGRLARIQALVVPAILAVAAIAAPASASATLTRDGQSLVITGGSGAQAWTLHYTTLLGNEAIANLATDGDQRAWFSHGFWLRLLDTQKGVVLGRWRFPGEVVSLIPKGAQVQVELRIWSPYERRAPVDSAEGTQILFDPAAPRIPAWPSDFLQPFHVPLREAIRPGLDLGSPSLISAEQARGLLPEMEEMVRRDPFSPWFRMALGRLLDATGDPRKTAVWEEALHMEGLDYTELFPISASLDLWKQTGLAREAFERGYRDYLDRGYDPRLHYMLIDRLITYPVGFGDFWMHLNPAEREEHIQRIYRFAPSGEAAGVAWEFHARELERNGRIDEAHAWRDRLNDAGKTAWLQFDSRWTLAADHFLLGTAAALLALLLFGVHRLFRYRPQRRLDLAQRQNRWGVFNSEYWSRGERWGFFVVTVAALLAFALLGGILIGLFNLFRAPLTIGMGNLAGVKTQRYLESLAPTPERDLYLAMSWQQSGETAKAEQLYRRLPDFAESWNNLGVILKGEGKNPEAQQAFQKALELDPQLNEAALNLGRKPADLWTSQYGSYFPGRPMLAPPRTAHSDGAFFGGSLLQASARAIVHPLEILRRVLQVTWSSGELALEVETICLVLGICALIFAVLLVSVIPHRDVTLPPAKGEWIWTTLFPGLGSEWGYLAWLVLAAWSYLLIQLGLFLARGTPYVFTDVSMPNLVGSYGLFASPMQYQLGGLNPGWMAMYAAPAALFAINALLVFRSRGLRNRGK